MRAVEELARQVEDAVETEEIGQKAEENVVVGRFDPRSPVQAGDRVDASVRPGAIRLFDRETGLAIRCADPIQPREASWAPATSAEE
jgi:hypothetical protein